MEPLNPPPPLRVLTRPSSATNIPSTSTSTSTSTSSLPTSSSEPHLPLSSNPTTCDSSSSEGGVGVVVVGFVGENEDQVSQLINRILDDNIFGSGNLDTNFPIRANNDIEGAEKRVKDWSRFRNISYFHHEEKGVVFLHFACTWYTQLDSTAVVEDHQFGDLQGMLFMFSVCHVIIYLQEGAHFDTHILKNFRLLQTAKHALVPFMKSHIQPLFTSKSSSLTSSKQPTVGSTSFKNSSGRATGMSNRHSSAISLMSGLGSHPSLFPGLCTPLLLFAFIDNFSEGPINGSHVEDSVETSSFNQSSNISGPGRPVIPTKGSNSVVVLSRPAIRSEGSLRKKLQSSLDAQIRFLIKKCRTLAGSEGSHSGPRGAGNVNSAPLFSLEPSRAVALLDQLTNQKGDSLDFATGLVEEVLKSKATSDILLLESNSSCAHKEDIQSVKEFIYRQSDTLRGRGGIVGNSNSGSAAGVGMAAAAAAAAAASAASGKPYSTPELPSIENWLYCSQLILAALLSARHGYLDKSDIIRRKPVRRNAVLAQAERVAPGVIDPVEAALCWLESGKGLDMKFSTAWCQRALPAAKDVYLKELPDLYPTSFHESQLGKSLHAFHTMVKGPAVRIFRKKLEDECTLIWRSGRQLCDAVSLTGNPCMHPRHNAEAGAPVLGADAKPHSSGFVFLHACACGRSRRLRDDPFDFEMANIAFNHFTDCDDLLPSLQLPTGSREGPVHSTSWSMIRVGGAKNYQPSKGLLHSGFCSTEKYLFKWSIYLEKSKESSSTESGNRKGTIISSDKDPTGDSNTDKEIKKTSTVHLFQGNLRSGVEKQQKISDNIPPDQKISFGRGLPQFTMRRPFAEVVAGSVATDAAFPPLQQRQPAAVSSEKGVKQKALKNKTEEKFAIQESKASEDTSSVRDSSCRIDDDKYSDNEPLLQIGSYILPVTMNGSGKIQSNSSLKHVILYVGFEHECSHGHRFLLNTEHLSKLGSFYSSPEDSVTSDIQNSERELVDSFRLSKSSAREKVVAAANNVRTASRPRNFTTRNERGDRLNLFSGPENERDQFLLSKSVTDLGESLQYASLDDTGSGLSLLKRNLPLYMNCPHCMNSKKDQQKFKFANKISQLQRIIVVTPPFPTVLAMCPVVQFEDSCLPQAVIDREGESQFSLGCRVILPPDSFLSLRLPFVYGVQLDDRSWHPHKPHDHQPELTAWITGGTTLQVISKESSLNEYNTYKS